SATQTHSRAHAREPPILATPTHTLDSHTQHGTHHDVFIPNNLPLNTTWKTLPSHQRRLFVDVGEQRPLLLLRAVPRPVSADAEVALASVAVAVLANSMA